MWHKSMRATRWAAMAASGLLVVFPLAGARGSGNQGVISPRAISQTASADSPSRIENYFFIGRGPDGVKRYELRATVFERLSKGRGTRAGTIRVKKPVLTVFTNGESLLTISSDSGESDSQGMFLLTGNVRINSSDDGYSIRTHSLRLFSRRKRITTPDAVIITGPDIEGKGLGMVMDCIDRKIELFGDSRMSMNIGQVPRFFVEAMDALPQALDACTDNLAHSPK